VKWQSVADSFVQSEVPTWPEQPSFQPHPRWSWHATSVVREVQAEALPVQRLSTEDHSHPLCRAQPRMSVSEPQSAEMPVQVLPSWQPVCVSQSMPRNEAHGVAVPEQYGLPEPGPVRSHHPAWPHLVRAGHSESAEHVATQRPAPMHITCVP
jgi:hypothetical protein